MNTEPTTSNHDRRTIRRGRYAATVYSASSGANISGGSGSARPVQPGTDPADRQDEHRRPPPPHQRHELTAREHPATGDRQPVSCWSFTTTEMTVTTATTTASNTSTTNGGIRRQRSISESVPGTLRNLPGSAASGHQTQVRERATVGRVRTMTAHASATAHADEDARHGAGVTAELEDPEHDR